MRLLWEAVNVACIKQVCGLRASNEVRIKLGGGATVSLRRMLHVFVVRETAAGGTGRIPVVVAENQVVAEYGLGKGRRYSGVHSMPEGLPKAAVVAINKAVKQGLTMWEATCSPFAYSRLVKEIVRQKVPCFDVDQEGSAPRAVQARHQSAVMDDYMQNREAYYAAAAPSRSAAKALYHSTLYGSVKDGKADKEFAAKTGKAIPKHIQVSRWLLLLFICFKQ